MKKALLLLGGSWHNFDGFAQWFSEFLRPMGWELEATFDLNQLLALEKADFDLVASYTCFSANPDLKNAKGAGVMEPEQVAALYNWVRKGGAFYAVHSACVLGETNPLYADLVGGRFIKHPPAFEYTVYPLFEAHQITEGIDAIRVNEELYISEYDGALHLLMASMLDEVIYPMVWCKHEGLGRVVHNSLGHNAETWALPEYEKLTEQSINWLLNQVQ
ncbi:MAG: ThuA domain-containing protein [Anaerolineae bacterium]|jgi:type 1 glutamine amidotransferase|nr:ThuA domain-containing protein [Anaerolineae bacterium]